MKEYIAKKVESMMKINDSRWESVPSSVLDHIWQDYHPSPFTTEAKLVHSTEGLTVRLSTTEWPITVTATENNVCVCRDSCVEFFFTPNKVDAHYVNFETNPAGVLLVEKGTSARERTLIDVNGSEILAQTMISPLKGWCAMIYIPYSFLKEHFSTCDKELRANFYKCGDDSALQHYSTWNPVKTPYADFHRPEFFGKITLSDETL